MPQRNHTASVRADLRVADEAELQQVNQRKRVAAQLASGKGASTTTEIDVDWQTELKLKHRQIRPEFGFPKRLKKKTPYGARMGAKALCPLDHSQPQGAHMA